MSPLEAAERLEQLGVDLEQGAVRAVDKTLKAAEQRAHELSQGTLSLADLRRMGHPYAIRNLFQQPDGSAPLSGAIINKQSTEEGVGFDESWVTDGPHQSGDEVEGDLFNTDDPVAHFLEDGTEKMWARPVNHRVGIDMEPVLREELGNETDRALRRAAGA